MGGDYDHRGERMIEGDNLLRRPMRPKALAVTHHTHEELRLEFIAAYTRWQVAMWAYEGEIDGAHIVNDAWEEYCVWRDMWMRSS